MDTSACEWTNLRSRLWHKILDLLPLRVRQIQALFKRVNHLPDVTYWPNISQIPDGGDEKPKYGVQQVEL